SRACPRLCKIEEFSEAAGAERPQELFVHAQTNTLRLGRRCAEWPLWRSVAKTLGLLTEYWILRKHPQTHGHTTHQSRSQPTKRNRFDSRSSFAPEIAARTPPSVPWTFPCLCVGFTSFLSTAPSAAPRSALEVIWSACTPAPATLSSCDAHDLDLLLLLLFEKYRQFLLQLSPDAAVLP
ncbi:unnamed protein product, partial [Aureobasidium vineae]